MKWRSNYFRNKVNNDGTIEATYGLDTTNVVGKISLADFVNEFGLQNIGSARFQETGESGTPTFGSKRRNFRETSSRFFRKIEYRYYR